MRPRRPRSRVKSVTKYILSAFHNITFIHRLPRSVDSYHRFVRLVLSCASENTATLMIFSDDRADGLIEALTFSFGAIQPFSKCLRNIG